MLQLQSRPSNVCILYGSESVLYTIHNSIALTNAFADTYSRDQLDVFLAESLIMKDFHHPHILGLLGVCFDAPDGSPYIVLPFMANGPVKTYLKERRAHVLDVNSFPQVLHIQPHVYKK